MGLWLIPLSTEPCARLEHEYRWIEAAKLYDSMSVSSGNTDLSDNARLAERSGYALYKAALQSETASEFQRLVAQSINAYERAAKLYASGAERSRLLGLRCRSKIDYLRFWQAKDIPERERVLNDSWDLACKVLDSLDTLDEKLEYSSTYNLLSWPAIYGGTLAPNTSVRLARIVKAIQHGERAVVFLSELGDQDGEARAAASTALFCAGTGSWLVADPEEKHRLLTKATEYWKRATRLSEDEAFRTWVVLAIIPSMHVGWTPGTETVIKRLEALLESSRKTRDMLVQASILNWLAFNSMWAALSAETSEKQQQLAQAAVGFRSEAENKFRILGIESTLENPETCFYLDLAEREIDPLKKRSLLENAIRASKADTARSTAYGHPIGMNYSEYHLAQSLARLASITDSSLERKSLLEATLFHNRNILRFFEEYCPDSPYDIGHGVSNIARVQRELALLISDPESKERLLRQAADGLRQGLSQCNEGLLHFESYGPIGVFGSVGRWQTELGDTLLMLFEISSDKKLIEEAIESFEASVDSFRRVNDMNRVSESQWRSANANAVLGNHLEASERFLAASQTYDKVAKNNPGLFQFYTDYGLYMSACAEIEKAKNEHTLQHFGQAGAYYNSAVRALESTERWRGTSKYYSALALIERAEALSQQDKSQESIQSFQGATKLLGSMLKTEGPESIASFYDQSRISELRKGARSNSGYCKSRILLEEARTLGKQGQYAASSDLFQKASNAFENVRLLALSKQESDDIQTLAIASRAYQFMSKAESEGSPSHFAEASKLFDSARVTCPTEQSAMLMAGHSSFCKALEKGTSFILSSDSESHKAAVAQFDLAASYYAKAGLTVDSEYAEASKLFFDGYAFMVQAHQEGTREATEKMRDYAAAEKLLLASARLFGKSGFTGKESEVLRLVEKVSNEKTLAISLADIVNPPAFTSVAGLLTIPGNESAFGLDSFEHARIEASNRVQAIELEQGGSVKLVLELGNVGKNPARLVRLEGLGSDDFDSSSATEFPVKNLQLELNGKTLNPLEMLKLEVMLQPHSKGVFTLSPILVYADENGKIVKLPVGPIDITTSPIADFLFRCFADDYLAKRLSRDSSGWRSLMEVVHGLKGPRSLIYGDPRYGHTFSKHLESLVAKKIVEHRIFPGERGRGGKIIRIRACLDNDVVRRLVQRVETSHFPILQQPAPAPSVKRLDLVSAQDGIAP